MNRVLVKLRTNRCFGGGGRIKRIARRNVWKSKRRPSDAEHSMSDRGGSRFRVSQGRNSRTNHSPSGGSIQSHKWMHDPVNNNIFIKIITNRLEVELNVKYSVPERCMDGITSLAGSGVAFAYQFIEALSDGGVNSGIPRQMATQLAAQTVLGEAFNFVLADLVISLIYHFFR